MLVFGAMLSAVACKEDLGDKTPSSSDKTSPGTVTDVQVSNTAGGAEISYSLPNEGNVLYVKAVYKLPTGETKIAKSSRYSSKLVLEGFADTLRHDVEVITVSKSEVESTPVHVTVKPLESPIWKVFKSLTISNYYGGYNLVAANVLRGNISLMVMRKNQLNEFEVDNFKSLFTNESAISSKVRGLDTTKQVYAFFVKDKWGNSTDTLYKEIKPLYETMLDIAKFRDNTLPGDASMVTNGNPSPRVSHLWDNRVGYPFVSFTNQTGTGGAAPHMITFDTGILSKVSRVWIRPFPEGRSGGRASFFLSTMKRFEIYGSVNPNPTGALDDTWIKLGTYELIRKSGLSYSANDTPEEAIEVDRGYDWETDLNAPKVRYIRIRCLENFAGGTNQSINELRVYGDPR